MSLKFTYFLRSYHLSPHKKFSTGLREFHDLSRPEYGPWPPGSPLATPLQVFHILFVNFWVARWTAAAYHILVYLISLYKFWQHTPNVHESNRILLPASWIQTLLENRGTVRLERLCPSTNYTRLSADVSASRGFIDGVRPESLHQRQSDESFGADWDGCFLRRSLREF